MTVSNVYLCVQCAKAIKELLDKKFGASWHVVVGEGFGFEISYEVTQETPLFLRPCKTPSNWKKSCSRKGIWLPDQLRGNTGNAIVFTSMLNAIRLKGEVWCQLACCPRRGIWF